MGKYYCPKCNTKLKWWKEFVITRVWNIDDDGNPIKVVKKSEEIIPDTGGLYCEKCNKYFWDEKTDYGKKIINMVQEIECKNTEKHKQ